VKPDSSAVLPVARPERPSVEIRSLGTHADFDACVALQRLTWGEDFAEIVPPSLLKVVTRIGGVLVGAFDDRGTLVGFVFGLTGIESGEVVHWSHMLAVAPGLQNRGIGRRLKEHQRGEAARTGARVMYWTFDPLVARNAQLNFNALGVRAVEYVENMYGASLRREHGGIGTDRLVVAWPVNDRELARRREEIAAVALGGDAPGVSRVEIPGDIEALIETDIAEARAWRERTRHALRDALAAGKTVEGFRIDPQTGRGSYFLRARGSA
jgi:predicted GNAT superfamily acetyltransferase